MPEVSSSRLHRSDVLHPLASYKTEVVFDSQTKETFEVVRRYEIQGPIGKGTYGYVVKATDSSKPIPQTEEEIEAGAPVQMGGLVAIKKVRNLFDLQRYWLSAVRELTMLRFFNHPNIISATDIMIPLGQTELTAQAIEARRKNFNEVYIVMDYMESTLREVMNRHHGYDGYDGKNPLVGMDGDQSPRYSQNWRWEKLKPLSAGQRAFILFQLLHGMKHMHESGVIHRDLKPENVLVDNMWCAKVCDFGQGRGGLVGDAGLDQTEIGQVTQWYCSPEQLKFRMMPDTRSQMDPETFHAVDVWSIGCIAAEMILGKALFDCSSMGGAFQLEAIMNVLGRPTDAEAEALIARNSHGMAEELTRSVVQHTENRLELVLRTAVENRPLPEGEPSEEDPDNDTLCKDKPDEDEIALIKAMLRYDPKDRITIADALQSNFFENCRDYTPDVPARPFPPINKAELEDASAARAAIWKLFVECDPVVSKIVEDALTEANERQAGGNKTPPAAPAA